MYLNCHSYYSLRYGTLSPEELVVSAATARQKVITLTDINNTSAASDFIKACKKYEIKPVLGIEFREGGEYRYTGIARNAEGFRELCAFLTECSLQQQPMPTVAPVFKNAFVIYRSLPKQLEDFLSNEFFGVRPGEVNKLFSSSLRRYPDKLVVFCPVTFKNENGWRAHKLLRCIDQNIVLSKLDPKSCAQQSEMFMPPEKLKAFFEQYPHILLNTEHLLDRCNIKMPTGYEVNRRAFTGNKGDDYKLLNKLAIEGCKRRYGVSHFQAMKRVKSELGVIEKMDFAPYFLITWDIVRYAQSSGYHHVGRGSGANSIVAYCLHITDVDPLELDLYFERFINPHRTSPPDFDIDFSWDERDDVTDYIFKRYGREYTALLATYNTFKGKSVIRELGKVFGLPKADIDLIVEQPMKTEQHHAFARHIFHYGKMITGFPNYLSIHAGGIIISERPLNYHTALQLMPKGFPITHFDMYAAEDIGFHKFDILSQRGLGHIKEAVDIINANHGKTVDIHNVDAIKQDEKVRAQLSSAHCIGCFYIESPAMRGLISKLRCDNYLHLVAASSIIRPGVAKSGMMREYIKRYHNPSEIEYLHPVFEKHLGETFGIMVYQEDVMKIVHHFADLDLDESDILRRIMTGKRKSSDTFRRLRDKYFINCKKKGYPDRLTEEVWRQIESFSGYSFCKAHSASFAVESFQSLYLKTYYPKEFMVAVINNFGGFYHTELYFHEARMCGAHIEAPCINHSTFLTNIKKEVIHVGFVHMKDFEQKVAREIVAEREQNGPYRSLGDFVNRVDIKKEQLEILVRINAFRFTGKNKYEMMWEKSREHNPQQHYFGTELLFPVNTEKVSLPEMMEGRNEQAFDEIEILGFPLCSPFDILEEKPTGDILSLEMKNYMGRMVDMIGYYVTRKYVTTINKKLMNFGTWVDRSGHFFDTVHFPQALERSPFLGRGCYRIRGKIVEDFGFPSMEAHSMEKLPYVRDERY